MEGVVHTRVGRARPALCSTDMVEHETLSVAIYIRINCSVLTNKNYTVIEACVYNIYIYWSTVQNILIEHCKAIGVAVCILLLVLSILYIYTQCLYYYNYMV